MPDIDREKFAYAVAARLKASGCAGPREAEQKFGISKSTWSRIGFAKPLSDGNFAAVCKVLDLDAREMVDMAKRHGKDMQAVARDRKRIVAEWGAKPGRKPAGEAAA